MNIAKAYRLALNEAKRQSPEASDEELDDEVNGIMQDWAAESAHDRESLEDTPCLEDGRDNCDDHGTGEGCYHGRM